MDLQRTKKIAGKELALQVAEGEIAEFCHQDNQAAILLASQLYARKGGSGRQLSAADRTQQLLG